MSATWRFKQSARAGFTVVEVMIIAPIMVLAIGIMITLIVTMTGEVLVSQARSNMVYAQQDALDRVQGDIELSTAFLAENDIAVVSPQGYNNDANKFTNVGVSGDTLILRALLTDKNPASPDRQLLRLKDAPNPCSSTNASANPLMYGNIVYFVKDGSLWRRTILPVGSDTIGCSVPWQISSCAPGVSGAVCKTNDIELVKGVSSGMFTVKYYTRANTAAHDTTAINAGSSVADRQNALNTTLTAEISLSSSQRAAGQDITYSSSLRATRQDVN